LSGGPSPGNAIIGKQADADNLFTLKAPRLLTAEQKPDGCPQQAAGRMGKFRRKKQPMPGDALTTLY